MAPTSEAFIAALCATTILTTGAAWAANSAPTKEANVVREGGIRQIPTAVAPSNFRLLRLFQVGAGSGLFHRSEWEVKRANKPDGDPTHSSKIDPTVRRRFLSNRGRSRLRRRR